MLPEAIRHLLREYSLNGGEDVMKLVAGRLSRLLVLVCLCAPGVSSPAAINWQSGRLVTLELDAQGASNSAKAKKNDVWWTYGICTAERTYYAVSRVHPNRMGLSVESPVRFFAGSKQITLDVNGTRYVLRILRQNNGTGCAGR